jgi:multiple sugar transport system substrate-binding protein
MKPRLTFWGREFEGFERALNRQTEAFSMAEVEVHLIEISRLERSVVDEDLATSGAADVLLLVTDWLPNLISAGKLLPLDNFLHDDPPEGWPDAWVPSLISFQMDDEGHIYGLPYHDGPVMTIYRSDLFEDIGENKAFHEKYGINLSPPDDWDIFLMQARWFNRPEKGLYGTVFAGFPDSHNNVYDFLTQYWARGGELEFRDSGIRIDKRVAQEALDYLSIIWHKERLLPPQAANWDSVASGVHFANGEIAVMVNWAGFAALSGLPGSPTYKKVKCAPAPAGPGPQGKRISLNAYWVTAIPRGAKDPKVSYEFLKHLASPAMDRITCEEGGTGVRIDTWRDPDIQKIAPYYEVLEEAHKSAQSLPRHFLWPTAARVLNEVMAEFVRGADVNHLVNTLEVRLRNLSNGDM